MKLMIVCLGKNVTSIQFGKDKINPEIGERLQQIWQKIEILLTPNATDFSWAIILLIMRINSGMQVAF